MAEKPDSLANNSLFISMGVLHKWGKKYYLRKLTDEYFRFYNLYIGIMHKIYPELIEYTPIQNLKINK
jgi:hypothetical protein